MKVEKPVCQQCRHPALGTLQTIPAVMLFHGDPSKGAVGYRDEPRIDWNRQRTVKGEAGLPLLTCVNGHMWESPIEAEQ